MSRRTICAFCDQQFIVEEPAPLVTSDDPISDDLWDNLDQYPMRDHPPPQSTGSGFGTASIYDELWDAATRTAGLEFGAKVDELAEQTAAQFDAVNARLKEVTDLLKARAGAAADHHRDRPRGVVMAYEPGSRPSTDGWFSTGSATSGRHVYPATARGEISFLVKSYGLRYESRPSDHGWGVVGPSPTPGVGIVYIGHSGVIGATPTNPTHLVADYQLGVSPISLHEYFS